MTKTSSWQKQRHQLDPFGIWGGNLQLRELEGDVFVEDTEWATLAEGKETEGMLFENATKTW
jgi:hypothetical protein